MIKLIAIDLDGTMVTSSRIITQRVRDSLTMALENNILPVIVTGRNRPGAETALETLDLDFPYISSAGALLRSGKKGETIHSWTFHEYDELIHIINFSLTQACGLIAEPDNSPLYWYGIDALNDLMDHMTEQDVKKSICSLDPEKDFNRPLLKITIIADSPLLAEAEKIVRAKCPSFHQVYSGSRNLDLTAKGVDKGKALQTLAEHLGILPSEIAAIGDQAIDLKMLTYSGLPIAMENAVPALKQVAKWMAPSNDDDGVAWAIDEILKQNAYNIDYSKPL